MTLSGRCACGAVHWETPGPVLWAGHCHCGSCRRASSAPFTSFFGVPRDTLIWRGKPGSWQSSPQVVRLYCGACGSQMAYQNRIWPNETHLYAASLNDPSEFHPEAHYHFSEALPWLSITDDLPRYPGSADTTDPIGGDPS